MPYLSPWFHFVWSTKNRIPFLDSFELRQKVWEHIKENAIIKEIQLDTINGYIDHCHCLISLRGDQTISKTIQLIKGESSHWINKNGLCAKKFEWQDHYYAKPVKGFQLESVREYINNQELHHKRIPFIDEFKLIISLNVNVPTK